MVVWEGIVTGYMTVSAAIASSEVVWTSQILQIKTKMINYPQK